MEVWWIDIGVEVWRIDDGVELWWVGGRDGVGIVERSGLESLG